MAGAGTFTQTGDLGQEFLKDKQANGSTQAQNPVPPMTLEWQEAALAVNLSEHIRQGCLALCRNLSQLVPEPCLQGDG